MNFFILWILLFLSSCAGAQYQRPRVDGELQDYKTDFYKLVGNPKLKGRLKKTEMFFDDLKTKETNIIGNCSLWDLKYNIIRIDLAYWKKATPTSQYFTVLHELGHCVCRRAHTDVSSGIGGFFENIGFKLGLIKKKGYLADGCPASIMHPSEFSEFCMLNNFMYYLNEFKKGCN